MSYALIKPTLNPEFWCSNCHKYRPNEVKSSKFLCCISCKEKVIAADSADKTDKIKREKVVSHALAVKQKMDGKMFNRELKIAGDINAWMYE